MEQDKKSLKQFLRPHYFAMISYAILSILNSVINIFSIIILANAIEDMTKGDYQKAIYTVLFIISLLSIKAVLGAINKYIYYHLSAQITVSLNYAF